MSYKLTVSVSGTDYAPGAQTFGVQELVASSDPTAGYAGGPWVITGTVNSDGSFSGSNTLTVDKPPVGYMIGDGVGTFIDTVPPYPGTNVTVSYPGDGVFASGGAHWQVTITTSVAEINETGTVSLSDDDATNVNVKTKDSLQPFRNAHISDTVPTETISAHISVPKTYGGQGIDFSGTADQVQQKVNNFTAQKQNNGSGTSGQVFTLSVQDATGGVIGTYQVTDAGNGGGSKAVAGHYVVPDMARIDFPGYHQ